MTGNTEGLLALPQAARTVSSQSIAQLAEYSYPQGHLGHLTEEESLALEQFKDVLEERGYWVRGPPSSHDEPQLL